MESELSAGSHEGTVLTHLFFDFFGTLVDYSASRIEQGYPQSHQILIDAGSDLSYHEFLQRFDENASRFDSEAERSLVEYSMHQVCGDLLEQVLDRRATSDVLDRFVERYLAEWNRGVVYLPELPAMLGRLSERYPLVVITNTHSAQLVPEHLRQMGIASRFEAVVTSIEHGRRKPHADIFRHALSKVGAVAETSAYIGDSFRADYQGPSALGMTAYLIDPACTAQVPDSARLSDILELERVLAD
jgi:putative hydrolase of the HAD superfamily